MDQAGSEGSDDADCILRRPYLRVRTPFRQVDATTWRRQRSWAAFPQHCDVMMR